MAGREAKAWGPPSTQGPWHSPRAQSHDTLVKRTQRAPASPSARGPWVAVPRPAGGPWARLARLCSPLGAGMVHLTGGLREKGSRGQTPAVTKTPGWGHSATGGVRVGLSVLWDPQLRAGGRGQGPPWLEGGWWFAFLLKQPPGQGTKHRRNQTPRQTPNPAEGPSCPPCQSLPTHSLAPAARNFLLVTSLNLPLPTRKRAHICR